MAASFALDFWCCFIYFRCVFYAFCRQSTVEGLQVIGGEREDGKGEMAASNKFQARCKQGVLVWHRVLISVFFPHTGVTKAMDCTKIPQLTECKPGATTFI